MRPILLRGAVLPTIKSRLFTTIMDNQEAMNIRVFQGERPQTKDNIYMGTLPALPLSGGKRGTAKVRLGSALCSDGRLTGLQVDVIVKVNVYQDEIEVSIFNIILTLVSVH